MILLFRSNKAEEQTSLPRTTPSRASFWVQFAKQHGGVWRHSPLGGKWSSVLRLLCPLALLTIFTGSVQAWASRSQPINIKHVWESGCLRAFTAVNERGKKTERGATRCGELIVVCSLFFPPSLFKQHKPILVGSDAHSEWKGLKSSLCLDTQAITSSALNGCNQKSFCHSWCGLCLFF